MRSHQRLKKGKKNVSSFGLLLSFYLGRCSSEFFFLSLFLSFHFSLYLHCLYLPESRLFFFFYYYYYFVREIILALERFQLIFPMVFHGGNGGRYVIVLYIFLKWRKYFSMARKKSILLSDETRKSFKSNIGLQIYHNCFNIVFNTFKYYFFLRLLLFL